MNVVNALPAGTVIKLREAEKKVIIIGILQQAQIGDKTENYDYIGVPYPEGFLGINSTLLFQETDIENIYSLGFSDIERQQFIAVVAGKMTEKEQGQN